MIAKFGVERELENQLTITEYNNGNGDFHFHSQIELCIVNNGELDVLVNNKRQRLKKGEISIALSYETHMYLPVVNSSFTVLIIPSCLCKEFTDNIKLQKITSPFIKNTIITQKISKYVENIKESRDDNITKTGYAYLILGLIIKSVSFEEKHSVSDTDLSSKILLYIHENFEKGISLLSISEHLGYNPSYISIFFKANFNIGIKRYINIVKLNNAISLLKENKYSITYCALESGFNSLRTFYRVFSTEFSCSPQEYVKTQKSVQMP